MNQSDLFCLQESFLDVQSTKEYEQKNKNRIVVAIVCVHTFSSNLLPSAQDVTRCMNSYT
jgi:hypothetical protein